MLGQYGFRMVLQAIEWEVFMFDGHTFSPFRQGKAIESIR